MALTDIRKRVEERLDALTQEQVDALVDMGLYQTKKVYVEVTCRHCDRRQKALVDMPQPTNIAKAIKDLGEFTKGKVPEQHIVDVRHWEAVDMKDWPTEALIAAANREVIEDAEYEALPAPSSED